METIGFQEDLTHEFKSDRNRLPDSGALYFGVEDGGENTGLYKDHLDSTRLAAFIANKAVPTVSVRVERLNLAAPVLKISVPRRTSAVASSSGKI